MFQRLECADLFRRVLFAEDVHGRNEYLAQIEGVHLSEFLDIFRLMGDVHVTVTVRLLATNNPRWAYDTYRRFLQMFGNVVLGTNKQPYEDILEAARKRRAVPHESLLPVGDLQEVVEQFKLLAAVPEDPWEQLRMAVEAVFRSWFSPLAVKYRDVHSIPGDLGTAVTVQSMVYGNQNVLSGSGVAFTRNPITGAKELYGEYLTNSEVIFPICFAT